jgi:chromosome segregation ATPase
VTFEQIVTLLGLIVAGCALYVNYRNSRHNISRDEAAEREREIRRTVKEAIEEQQARNSGELSRLERELNETRAELADCKQNHIEKDRELSEMRGEVTAMQRLFPHLNFHSDVRVTPKPGGRRSYDRKSKATA